MMSKSFFLCAEPDSKLKSDRLSPKQIYESRGQPVPPRSEAWKEETSEASFFFASALFPLQLAAQPPMTLRGPVEQSEKGGGGRAKREGGRGERSGQVVHCEPVSVPLSADKPRCPSLCPLSSLFQNNTNSH